MQFYFLVSSFVGLDIDKDHIVEMACIITDENLEIIAEVCCLFSSLSQNIDAS